MRIAFITAAALLGAAATAQGPGPGIVGTKHDFSAQAWSGNEICRACHIPHVTTRDTAQPTRLGALLWGREMSTQTYTAYTSTSMQSTMAAPDGSTLLCLSCHDGTVALENFHLATGGTNFVAATAQVPGTGTAPNLSFANDHPVSMVYDETADPGLNAKTTAVGGGLTGYDIQKLLDGSNKVQCMSCHDPHNVWVEAGATKFLRRNNTNSALCLVCHDK